MLENAVASCLGFTSHEDRVKLSMLEILQSYSSYTRSQTLSTVILMSQLHMQLVANGQMGPGTRPVVTYRNFHSNIFQ